MRAIIAFALASTLSLTSLFAQEPFSLRLEEVSYQGMPGIQSFAIAHQDSFLLLMGGRIEGLHNHRPPVSFGRNFANDQIWLLNTQSESVTSVAFTTLPTPIQNQLYSTNINFEQVGSMLYLLGGYGIDNSDNLHHTHGVLSVVDIPSLINAIQTGGSIDTCFSYLEDTRFKVTGGHLHSINDTLYLVGGQDFDGRYNPMNGPSFTQSYTSALTKFTVDLSSGTPSVSSYSTQVDVAAFHRRDYNVVPQIFADGTLGLTAFTGVFQIGVDLPFLDVVNIKPGGYNIPAGFEQKLNQYHTAVLPLYDSTTNEMHTVFFGGIGQYYYNDLDSLIEDENVPFVKTISRVTRFSNDSLAEIRMSTDMPGYLGASAEFVHKRDLPIITNGIVDMNDLPVGETHVGYIIGGIESPQPNVFRTGVSSSASSKIFKVLLTKAAPSGMQMPEGDSEFNLYPNPNTGDFTLKTPFERGSMAISIFSTSGSEVYRNESAVIGESGEIVLSTGLSSGTYVLSTIHEGAEYSVKFHVRP